VRGGRGSARRITKRYRLSGYIMAAEGSTLKRRVKERRRLGSQTSKEALHGRVSGRKGLNRTPYMSGSKVDLLPPRQDHLVVELGFQRLGKRGQSVVIPRLLEEGGMIEPLGTPAITAHGLCRRTATRTPELEEKLDQF